MAGLVSHETSLPGEQRVASPRGLSCARVCVPGVSSHEDTGPLGLEFVTLMTPFNLITSLKAPPPD